MALKNCKSEIPQTGPKKKSHSVFTVVKKVQLVGDQFIFSLFLVEKDMSKEE